MPAKFFQRLQKYYSDVAKVLRGEADAASIFPNSTDVGQARERVYAEFLRLHAPSKCNVFLGGFLFDEHGSESKQLDVLVTTDTAPRFNFHNRSGDGKAFSPVEGTLGVFSIKSTLDKQQLFDALEGLASIPPTRSVKDRISPLLSLPAYEDWPYKVIYATQGLTLPTIWEHLESFYGAHPDVPLSRRPHIIHVAGKYAVFRIAEGMKLRKNGDKEAIDVAVGSYHAVTSNPDIQAIAWVVHELQKRAMSSQHIMFSYGDLLDNVVAAGVANDDPAT
jgi:hypothetical protein